MTEQLADMVRKGNPQAIQKYVQNQLTDDPASLERIYKELLDYTTKPLVEQKLPTKSNRSRSLASLPLPPPHPTKKQHPLPMTPTRRTQTLLRTLIDKGFKATPQTQTPSTLGLQLFKSQRLRMVKPLQTNSKLMASEEALIDNLINRYNINCQFYENDIEDVKIDVERVVDREMKQFIDRRRNLLDALRKNEGEERTQTGGFGGVGARVYSRGKQRISYEKVPQANRNSNRNKLEIAFTQKLLAHCTLQISRKCYKQLPASLNQFVPLQQKLERSTDQVDLATLINFDKIREKMAREQYDRYTHSYMKMMTNKTQEGSKCKLNVYAKELLQDERKMRNIIDFSKK